MSDVQVSKKPEVKLDTQLQSNLSQEAVVGENALET